jgi:mono/diheme cytochrome c family protein
MKEESNMKPTITLLLALLLTPVVEAAPFEKGNVEAGKTQHGHYCVSCHMSQFGGDGSKIYTRADRRIRSAPSLAQQITTCNANLGNKLFPEDEADIGAYLNKTYYKFK